MTIARSWRSSGTWATPRLRALRGSIQAPGRKLAPPTSSVPALGASRPDNTSSNSLWPLPETPAIPTISPARSAIATSCRRTTCSASRTTMPLACINTSPGGLSVSPWRPICTLRPTMASARDSMEVSAIATSCTTRPPRMTVTKSHRRMTSLSLWVISRMVVPWPRSSASTPNNCSVSCGVSTAVGSSRIRMRAPRYRVLRISSRWRSPTDRSATSASRSTRSPVDVHQGDQLATHLRLGLVQQHMRLGAEHHVLQRGQRIDQHEVLVHHADAQRDRLMRIADRRGLPIDPDAEPLSLL
jgi:hypothetical protein